VGRCGIGCPSGRKTGQRTEKLTAEVEQLRKQLEKQGNDISFAVLINLAVTYGLPEVKKSLLK